MNKIYVATNRYGVTDHVDSKSKIGCGFVKILILTALIGLGTVRIYACSGLYADGAFHLYTILSQNTFVHFNHSRIFAETLSQSPVVLAVSAGIRDLNWLAVAHSIGLVGFTVGFWLAALLQHYRTNLFWFFALGFAASYLNSNFFAVGEYNITYSMVAFCMSVLLSEELSLLSLSALVIVAIILIRSYEAMIYFGPTLFCIAIYRLLDSERMRLISRLAIGVSCICFALASAQSAWSIAFPEHPESFSSAADIVSQVRTPQVIYTILICFMAFVAYIAKSWKLIFVMIIGALIGSLIFLYNIDIWNSPPMYYTNRTASGVMLLFVLIAASSCWALRRRIRSEEDALGLGLIVANVVVTLSVVLYIHTFDYYRWMKAFESQALTVSGFVPIEKTGMTYYNRLYGDYSWDWCTVSMSILLRGNASGGISTRSDYKGWDPIDPTVLEGNPLGAYTKTKRLYL